MRRVPRDHLFKVSDRFLIALLRTRDATELVIGVDLLLIDGDCLFESLTSSIQLPALLINKSQVVMRRSIGGIERRRLEVLFERRFRTLVAHDVAEVTAQQHEKKEQQERRT